MSRCSAAANSSPRARESAPQPDLVEAVEHRDQPVRGDVGGGARQRPPQHEDGGGGQGGADRDALVDGGGEEGPTSGGGQGLGHRHRAQAIAVGLDHGGGLGAGRGGGACPPIGDDGVEVDGEIRGGAVVGGHERELILDEKVKSF